MKVAVAVITDSQQRFLIAKRPSHVAHPGLWEFPGGKLEGNESSSVALIREVQEEIGLQVIAYDYLGEVKHSYGEKKVSLLVFHVHEFAGDAHCLENQPDLRWVGFTDLKTFEFPAANKEIIKLIKEKLNLQVVF